MGKPRVYQYNDDSKQMELSFDPGVSEKQNAWLTDLCNDSYPELRYAIKNGEQRVRPCKLKVNGYDPLTNTAFDFDSCYFHGCECVKPSRSKNAEEIKQKLN